MDGMKDTDSIATPKNVDANTPPPFPTQHPSVTLLTNFRLFDLSPELTDLIFGHMLESGSMAILRTSKELYSQASRFISSRCTYRVEIKEDMVANPGRRWLVTHPPNYPAPTCVQNFDINITLRHCTDAVRETVQRCTGIERSGKLCCITIIYDDPSIHGTQQTRMYHQHKMIEVVRKSVNFDTVLVLCQFKGPHDLTESSVVKDGAIEALYETFGTQLKDTTLGPAQWVRDGAGGDKYMRFHPRAYQALLKTSQDDH